MRIEGETRRKFEYIRKFLETHYGRQTMASTFRLLIENNYEKMLKVTQDEALKKQPSNEIE